MRYGIFMTKDLAQLNLKFDGPAVENHTIDVNDLAPSLLEWANALGIVSEAVAPDNPRARLVITPESTKRGSFLMEMSIDLPGIIEQAVNFFNSRQGTAIERASNIGDTLIAAVATVYGVKRTPTKEDPRNIEKDHLAEEIARDPKFISSVQKATDPVSKPGFTEISISTPADSSQTVTVTTQAHQAVEEETEDRKLIRESDRDVTVSIENLDFQEGKPWKLDDGDNTFTAAMRDSEFQRRIDEGEVQFGKRDLLDINLITKQYQLKSGRLRNYHFVSEVKAHYPNGQLQLPFDE